MNTMVTNLVSRFLPCSLRARLLLLVFVAVIPALALILYTDRDQRRMAEEDAREHLVRLSQVINDENKLLVQGARHFFFQAEDGIRDGRVTGVQTCALPI